VSDWILTQLDLEIENTDIDSQLQEELIDMTMNLEAKALFRSKSLSDYWYWSNENTVAKYPRIYAVIEPFLLAFPNLCMVKASFSHTNAILMKQRNKLNLEERDN